MTDRTERAPSAFRLNLEQQKNRAKDLLRAAKAVEKEALARIVAVRAPAANANGAALKLADAQFVVARELRFASWAKLKSHIASMERQWTAIGQKQAAPDAGMKTLHVRCGHDIQNTLKEACFMAGLLSAHHTLLPGAGHERARLMDRNRSTMRACSTASFVRTRSSIELRMTTNAW